MPVSDMPDLATFKRSSKPNNYLIAPEGYCVASRQGGVAPIFDVTPAELYQAILDVCDSQPNWTLASKSDVETIVHIIAKTKVLRFKDDVFIRVLAVDDQADRATLAVYSRSRVGHSDFGKNRSRVTRLLEVLKAI